MSRMPWQIDSRQGLLELLDQDVLNRAESLFHQFDGPAVHSDGHFAVVESHLMQNGGLKIADVVSILNGVITGIIGRAVDDSGERRRICG